MAEYKAAKAEVTALAAAAEKARARGGARARARARPRARARARAWARARARASAVVAPHLKQHLRITPVTRGPLGRATQTLGYPLTTEVAPHLVRVRARAWARVRARVWVRARVRVWARARVRVSSPNQAARCACTAQCASARAGAPG